MKKLLAFVALLVVLPSVFALQLSSPVLIGAKGTQTSASVTITNDGLYTLTNIQLTSDALGKYNVLFENTPATLNPGASAQFLVKGTVPSDFSSDMTIGNVKATAQYTILGSVTSVSLSNSVSAVTSISALSRAKTPSVSYSWQVMGKCGQSIVKNDCLQLPNVQFGSGVPVSGCSAATFGNHYVDLSSGTLLNGYTFYECVATALSTGPTVPGTLPPNPPSIIAPSVQTVTASAPLTMKLSSSGSGSGSGSSTSKLLIDRVKIDCDNKLETVTEDESIEASPGKTCFITVRVENNHNEEIEDVEIRVEPENSDITDDDIDAGDLDDGDKVEKTLQLDIDEDADGDYEVEVSVDGTDQHNKVHSDSFKFTIEVEKQKHNIVIQKATVTPAQVDRCSASKVDIRVDIENSGIRDEDDARVEVSIPGLNFKDDETVELEEGDETTVRFSVPTSKLTPYGSFKGTVKAFYDNVAETDSREITVIVAKCGNEQEVVENDDVVVPPPFVDDTVEVPAVQEEKSNVLFTVGLVAANVIALTMLGVMGYGLFRKPKEQY